MNRVYDYRLLPTKAQEIVLLAMLESLRLFYNAALQERREDYRRAKEAALDHGGKPRASVSLSTQEKAVKVIKALCPEYDAIHTHLYQDVLTRLQGAFDRFFKGIKEVKKTGFPRFKPYGRYRSFTLKDAGNGNRLLDKDAPVRRKKGDTGEYYPAMVAPGVVHFRLVAANKRLYLHGIGKVRIRLHRPYQGKVKQVRIIHKADGWYAQFVCTDVPKRALEPTGKSVGIDVGISTFAAMSNGEMVPNPRFREEAQVSIRAKSKAVSRAKRGSNRRAKAVDALAKVHARAVRKRTQFHHETAKALVERFDAIAVEDLNIQGLARGMLSKQVHDVAWGAFMLILAGKAESAGREFVKVPCAGTSQECSGCHATVRKGLHVRVHRCPECGLELDRDTNAAINIHGRGKAAAEVGVTLPLKREAPSLSKGQVGE